METILKPKGKCPNCGMFHWVLNDGWLNPHYDGHGKECPNAKPTIIYMFEAPVKWSRPDNDIKINLVPPDDTEAAQS